MREHQHQHRNRVIISTDAKNEADDQFAIVHALLTPSFENEGIIAAHFGTERQTNSMEASREEIDRLIALLGAEGRVSVRDGSATPIADEHSPTESEGADLIIEAALRNDPRPLQLVCLGPLTDLASALLVEPQISQANMRVIWIGGGVWPDGGWEYNLSNDIAAANVVFDSGLEILQVPRPVFNRMQIGYAELEEKVASCGDIGRYLVDEVYRFNDGFYSVPIEHRPLADSAAVGIAMYEGCGSWIESPSPRFGPDMKYQHSEHRHTVRVYTSIDARYIHEDLFAKLRRFSDDGLLPL